MLTGQPFFVDMIAKIVKAENLSEKDQKIADVAIETLNKVANESDGPEDYQTTMSSLMDIVKEQSTKF